MGNVVHLYPAQPAGFGLVHVDLSYDGSQLEVIHESRSGESFALLQRFSRADRDLAIASAFAAISAYQPCKLGRVAS